MTRCRRCAAASLAWTVAVSSAVRWHGTDGALPCRWPGRPVPSLPCLASRAKRVPPVPSLPCKSGASRAYRATRVQHGYTCACIRLPTYACLLSVHVCQPLLLPLPLTYLECEKGRRGNRTESQLRRKFGNLFGTTFLSFLLSNRSGQSAPSTAKALSQPPCSQPAWLNNEPCDRPDKRIAHQPHQPLTPLNKLQGL